MDAVLLFYIFHMVNFGQRFFIFFNNKYGRARKKAQFFSEHKEDWIM